MSDVDEDVIDNQGEEDLIVMQNNNNNTLDQDDYDNDNNYDEAYEDDFERQKSKTNLSSSENNRGHIYQNELNKPIIKAGSLNLGLAQAKLFGLVDSEGNIKGSVLKDSANSIAFDKSKYERINNMSKRHEKSLSHVRTEEDIECTFKPSRPEAAERAMRNGKCGYDFLNELNQKGSFMKRNDVAKTSGPSKAVMDQMEADYDARLDKLVCPKCQKPQSFKSYFENTRECLNCKVRFEKKSVFNRHDFEKRTAEAAKKKEARLAEVEKTMYSKPSATAALPLAAQILANKNKTSTSRPAAHAATTTVASTSAASVTTASQKQVRPMSAASSLNKTAPGNINSSGETAIGLLQKMSSLQSAKADLIGKTISSLENSNNNSNTSINTINKSSSNGKPPTAVPNKLSGGGSKTSLAGNNSIGGATAPADGLASKFSRLKVEQL